MIEVTDLNAGYGEKQVLYDVTCSIERGEVVALIGPNGVGKTTLFRTISGAIEPYSGRIIYKDEGITGVEPHARARNGLIHVPQEDNIFEDMTVMENLKVASYMPGVRDRREKLLDLVFDLFPWLADRKNQIAGTLSGGERQMLGISKGLMSDPDLLLLDEPSTGLAPSLINAIYAKISQIQDTFDVTIFITEQRVIEAFDIAERAYVLENGRIVLEGPVDELIETDRIQESYLGV